MVKIQVVLIVVMILMFWQKLVFASENKNSSTLTLSLKDAISTALLNNQTILNDAKSNLKLASRNLIAIHKLYQPKISLDISSQRTTNETELTSTRQDKYSTSLNSTWSKVIFTSGVLTLSEGYNLSEDKNSSQKFSTNPYVSIGLNQPLSEGGKLQQRLSLINADENLKLEKMKYALIEEQLTLNVICNYYQLIRANLLVKQAEEQVALSKQLLKWTEARLKVGQIAELDVMNAKVQLANDEDFLVQSYEQRQTLQRSFLRLLGLSEDLKLELSDEIEVKILNEKVEESINAAIENRLEIKMAKISIEQSKRNIPIARSTNKPTLTISGNYSWTNESEELEEAIKELPQRNWLIQTKLSFPFFDSGSTKNQVKIAEINYQKTLNAFEQLKKDIIEEITQIHWNLNKNQRRLEVLEVNLKIAQDARRISQLKYEMGLLTIREVLQSQITYSNVKISIDDAKIDYLINQAKLSKAIGKLKNEYL
ncbi:MAG: TolC family protein [bacterium]